MRFSKEDIEEIRKKLELLYPPKNDWQLGKCVLPVKGEEEVVIMQGGRNVRCNLKDIYKFVSMREFGSFVNMDEYAGLPVTDLETAISYVDPVFRRRGMVLTFQTHEIYEDPDNLNVSRPVWETWQFTGELSQWDDPDKWTRVWSQDVNNVRITGAKVEGRELFIRVGSSWVRTDVNFDAISGSLSSEDAERLIERIETLETRIIELKTECKCNCKCKCGDEVALEGEFFYTGSVPSSGGSPVMTNTLRLVSGGEEQEAVITYSVPQQYASVDQETGQLTFSPSSSQNSRIAVVTATCVFNGVTYTKTASAAQSPAQSSDTIELDGSFSYPESAPASGGTANPSFSLSLMRNGVEVAVPFTFTSDRPYASVDSSTGVVVFQESQSESQRSAVITASCTYGGRTYSMTAVAGQEAYVPATVELTGSFLYSGKAPASGGSLSPINTLVLTKNGVEQDVTFTFSSNQTYASVVTATGAVTFASSQSVEDRYATITASCVFDGVTYTKTAVAIQSAYVPSATYVYAGSFRNTTSSPVGISSFTAGASSTTRTVNYTPSETVNTIIAVCPSSLTLASCVKHGEIEDDITELMLASETAVTYNGKASKMYQFKYGASIKNNAFTITFN